MKHVTGVVSTGAMLAAMLLAGCSHSIGYPVPDRSAETRDVSRCVASFVKATYPAAAVVGVWQYDVAPVSSAGPGLYYAAADIVIDKKRKTLDVIVRSFVDAAGKPYWKADPVTGSTQALLNSPLGGTALGTPHPPTVRAPD